MPAVPNPMMVQVSTVARAAQPRLRRGRVVPYDPIEGAARTIDGLAGHVGMGAFLGLPLAGGAVWAVGKAGDGIGKLMPGVGSVISQTAAAVGQPIQYLEKPIEATRFAGVVGMLDRVLFQPMASAGKIFNTLTGGFLENRAVAAVAKKNTHALTAMSHARGLASANANFAVLPEMVQAAIASGDMQGLTAHIGEVEKHAKGALKPLLKGVGKHAGNAVSAGVSAEGLFNMAHGVSDAKAAIGKTSVSHVTANMAFIAGGAASAYLTAKDINSDMRAYAELLSDLTGKPAKQFGAYDMFIGDTPYAAKIARNSLLLNAGPRAVAEAANTVLNLKMLKGGFSMPLMLSAMVIPMASQGIGMLTGGNVLDAYKEMRANEEKGEHNKPEDYAKLLGMASEELSKQGGENSQFTKALAEVYASQNVSVRQVMRAITTGKVMQDVRVLQQQYMAAQEQEHAAHQHSHVEGLNKKREVPSVNKTPREALGVHTQSVIEQAQQPSNPQLGGVS